MTNWEKYFGTPEKFMRVYMENCIMKVPFYCSSRRPSKKRCPFYGHPMSEDCEGSYDAILEWLQEEAS